MAKTPRGRGPGGRKPAPQIKVAARWNPEPAARDLRSIHDIWRATNGAFDMGWTPETILWAIRPYHPQALVTEVVGEGHDYKNMIVGKQWHKLHGHDVTGSLLSDYADKEVQLKTRVLFRKVVGQNEPVFLETPPPVKKRMVRRHNLEMMFLPLIGLEGVVTHFITAVPFFG